MEVWEEDRPEKDHKIKPPESPRFQTAADTLTNQPTQTTVNSIIDKTATPVSEAVQEFLRTQADPLTHLVTDIAHDELGRLVSVAGHLPVVNVPPQHVSDIIFRPAVTSHDKVVELFDYFFWWCNTRGYLPVDHLSPVAALCGYSPNGRRKWSISEPYQLKALFAGSNSVEFRLYLALASFAGLYPRELSRMEWTCINSGKWINLGKREALKRSRVLRVLPVLDPWIRPFYGQQGDIINFDAPAKLYRFAKSRGIQAEFTIPLNSYFSNRMAVVDNLHQVAMECGYESCSRIRCWYRPVTSETAEEYFSLTPEQVGINDWPGLVSKHLRGQNTAHGQTP